jgi:hypothetical protein
MSHELELLERRIRRLELQNRRLKWLGVMFAVFAALAVAKAASAQKTGSPALQAQKFELLDDTGRLRAELAILEGGPALRFFDQDGDVECLLAGDQFNIFKKRGDLLASFGFNGVRLEDGGGKVFVTLRASAEEQMGKLQMNDYRHKIYAGVTPGDLPKLHSDKAR